MQDPTREEIVEFLRKDLASMAIEWEEFAIEEAIYWFAYRYHSGQDSNLYSILSTSEFIPGVLSNGPSENAEFFFNLMEIHFDYFIEDDQ